VSLEMYDHSIRSALSTLPLRTQATIRAPEYILFI